MPIPTSDDPKRPDYLHPDAADAATDLQLVHDLLGGTRTMQANAAAQGYIPQWPDETSQTYAKRIRSASVYEGLGRTLSASVGMLFATPPVVTYAAEEAALAADWANLDGMGNQGAVVLKAFADLAIRDGLAVLLVDHPTAPAGVTVTAANERELGLRPRWAAYPRATVLSWRTAVIQHETRVTQCVLYEPAAEETDLFGTTTRDRYRALWVRNGVAGWTLYERPAEGAAADQFAVIAEGTFRDRRGRTRDTLPIAIAYTGRVERPFVCRAPLMGVAFANLDHWRDKTELRWGSRIAAIEQFVVKGQLLGQDGQPGTLKIGWEHAVNVEATGDALWTGPTGRGLGELEKRMREAEQEMAALGMSFLARDTRSAETAEAKRLDSTAENSTLATAGQAIEDAANLAWQHHAWFRGLAADAAPTVQMNRDFERTALSAPELTAIATLAEKGLPKQQLTEVLVARGFIKASSPEEVEAIALEWEAGADAAADVARMQREVRALPDAA